MPLLSLLRVDDSYTRDGIFECEGKFHPLEGKLTGIKTLVLKTGHPLLDKNVPDAVIRACPNITSLKLNMGGEAAPPLGNFAEHLDQGFASRFSRFVEAAADLESLKTLEIFKFGLQLWTYVDFYTARSACSRGWKSTDIDCT